MLKKLRKQFMFSNLFLVGVIIAVFFGSLLLVTYEYERQQSIDILTLILENTSNVPDAIILDEKSLSDSLEEDTLARIRTVVMLAQTDNEGRITAYAIEEKADISSKYIYEAVNMAVSDTEMSGETSIGGTMYRYLKMSNGIGGYKIAFSDTSTEVVTFRFMMRLYLFTALFFFGVMFLISDYMSHKAITPVEKSWDNQNRFVADASHELKTPLTIILANMDIMMSNPESTIEEQQKWIENTKSEAKRMADLVNDMLFLAKSDVAVEQSANFAHINYSSLAEDCVLTFESVAFEKGVTFKEEITPDIYVKGDEVKLKQAMMILLDNAIKYVNEGGMITVSLNRSTRNNIRLTVLNTGTPIPDEKQKYIFERFFRADESRARDKGGYGLGLSIARHIMDMHRGKITLDFSDERGTSFSLFVPDKQFIGIKRKRT